MKINNKKASIEFFMIFISMLISIGTLLFIVATNLPEQHIGETQIVVLNAIEQSENKANYLDMASIVASKKVIPELINRKGFLLKVDEHEKEEYPCKKLIQPILDNNNCFPQFQKNYARLVEREIKLFSANKNIRNQFRVNAKSSNNKITLDVIAQDNLITPIFSDTRGYAKSNDAVFKNQQGYTVYPTLKSHTRNNEIDSIVMHYTVTKDVDSTYQVLSITNTSYNYVISKSGEIYQFVPESNVAYHAGCRGYDEDVCQPGYNSRSIGISLVGCGYNTSDCPVQTCQVIDNEGKCFAAFTQEQIEATTNLLVDISRRNNLIIDEDTLIMHSDINSEKSDPGPAFPKEAIVNFVNNRLK